MLITLILFIACIALFGVYFWRLKLRYKYFVHRNIPGPSPQLFFGHSLKLWSVPLSFHQIHEWTSRYGSIYGIFEGTRPIYIVSDVDFLHDVYIKQFSSFHSRPTNFLNRVLDSKGAHLFSAHANQWRRQRHVINPTFTTLKLKTMTPLINECIQSMMVKVAEMNDLEFNIYALYKRLTMDIIWHCIFGIDTDMQNDLENIYMKKSAASVAIVIERLSIVKLSILMPFLIPILTQIVKARFILVDTLRAWLPPLASHIEELPNVWIMKRVENVVKERLQSGIKRRDLLQLMLDTATDEPVKDHENDELMSKHLHYTEVLMNIFLFMVAGYETTASILAYSTYVLATKMEVQQKLQAEIDEHWQEDNTKLDYEQIAEMTYMDLFLREVLRLYAASNRVRSRESNATTIVCGHQIEKGTIIMPDVYSLHRNIDLWGPEDVNLFIPERHSVKRHPVAFIGFGIGPRNCVGMRFALMELKMCLAHLLYTYNILPGDKLHQGMTIRETNVTAPDAIYIRLEKRVK